MPNYIREHSFGSLVRCTFSIYRNGFGVLFISFALPTIPILYLQSAIGGKQDMLLLSFVIAMTVNLFIYGANVVTISDICIGNRPSFKRSYKNCLRKSAKLVSVGLLQTLLIGASGVCIFFPVYFLLGFLGAPLVITEMLAGALSIVAIVLVALWTIYSPIIVILENKSGVAAILRSWRLGKGGNWRAFRIVLFVVTSYLGLMTIVGAVSGLLLMGVGEGHLATIAAEFVAIVLASIVSPLVYVSVVLLYYDFRGRKEAYDASALVEEVKRYEVTL
ncbi:hypothetical protein [Massilia sp. METH4]|uniref:hypothetical protein n=1 Tax=Massilia sp. METH4 TaxID=3123041 RepID=UPI0030D4FB88